MTSEILNIQKTILAIGWMGMIAGVVSGAIIGLFFHRDEWLGGYGSFTRRMVRLGHISFFGLGFLNILYGLTLSALSINYNAAFIAAIGLILGAVTMPACCFLCALHKKLWLLFPIPVTSLLIATVAITFGIL